MRTIERNYRKNPHTARWLMTFHTAGGTRPVAEKTEETRVEIFAPAAKADHRSPAQRDLMERLIVQIEELDAGLGAKSREWTDKATKSGVYWTAGRDGTASAWISKMIDKVRELKASRPAPAATPIPVVADGRYAVEIDGTIKFYKVKNGSKPGFVFLSVQASDDWHSVHGNARRAILALIAQDPKAAMVRYGREIGSCGKCGRTLTDENSRAAGIGPICAESF